MLKGDRMCVKTDSCFIDGAQFGGLVDRPSSRMMPWSHITEYFNRKDGALLLPNDLQERIDRTFKSQYQPAKRQSQPAKLRTKADKRYYRLYDGNILDTESKTILNRDVLIAIMEA